MSRTNEFRLRLGYAGICLAVATPGMAWAQDKPSDQAQGQEQTQASAQAQDEASDQAPASAQSQTQLADASGESIIVTGSRLANRNAISSVPVMTVTGDQLLQRGIVNLADAIKAIPQVGPNALAPSAQVRDSLFAGIFVIDLRGLGPSRTLILVNGRRHVPGFPGTSFVDINTIPVDLIDRIEVTTGGASAVYGSDAVAGVVNVILRKDFEGLQLRSQYGISSRGDAQQFKISLLGGGNFAGGRGNATLFASYDRNGRADAVDRKFSKNLVVLPNPFDLDSALFGRDALNAGISPQGVFGLNPNPAAPSVGGSTIRRTVLPDGTVTTPNGPRDGLDPQPYLELISPNKRFLLGGNFRYELTDHITAFLDTAFSRADVYQSMGPTAIQTGVLNIGGTGPTAIRLTIPSDNPFIPAAMKALIPANRPVIAFNRNFPEFGPRETTHSRTLFRIVPGLEGNLPLFGSDWHWEAYYQYGKTTQDQDFRNGINTLNLFQALRVEPNGAGGFRCVDAAARAAGCIPVNLFTGHPLTDAERAFIGTDASIRSQNTQQVAAASISGDLFELPAGPVQLALGGEWRKDESVYKPSELLRNGLISLQFVTPTRGSISVKEAFAETKIPLLKDLPAIEYLEAEAAYRIADYSSSGTVSAWKLGGTYRPIHDVRLRSVLAKSVRAPGITELFAGPSVTTIPVSDPCAPANLTPERQVNCATFPGVVIPGFNPGPSTPVLTTVEGNPDLTPEKAKTWTVGGVVTPSFIPGLAFSIDYFRIHITNGIAFGGLGAQATADLCADTADPLFCDLVTRDPSSGLITGFKGVSININEEVMKGLDIELHFNRSLGRFGRVNLAWNHSRLFSYKFIGLLGAPAFELQGTPIYPEDRGNLALNWAKGPFTAAANLRYIGEAFRTLSGGTAGEDFPGNRVPPYAYLDLQLGYTLNKRHNFYIGARNVLDKQPPFFPLPYFGASSGPNTAAGVYDVIGRFFYAGISAKF